MKLYKLTVDELFKISERIREREAELRKEPDLEPPKYCTCNAGIAPCAYCEWHESFYEE